MNPSNVPSYLIAAGLYAARKLFQQAFDVLDQAKRLDPDANTVQRLFRRIMYDLFEEVIRLDNREEGLSLASIAVSVDPGNALAKTIRAKLLLTFGRAREALNEVNAALNINPNQPNALNLRAVAHYRLNHLQDALYDAYKSLWAEPHNPNILSFYKEIEAKLINEVTNSFTIGTALFSKHQDHFVVIEEIE